MGAVYALTLRQLSGRWRLSIIAVVSALPVLITLLAVGSESAMSVSEFESVVLGALLAGSAAPLVVLAIAGAAFGNEVEDKTLANLTLAPLPRWRIALPKVLAAITVAGPFIALSAFLTAHVAFLGDVTASLAVTASVLIGVALYASVFVWLGLAAPQAIGVGLLYIVLWEGLLSGFVSGVRMLSIRHHAIALMHGIDARRFAGPDHVAPELAAALSVLVFGGFIWLAARHLRRMDVP
jgi:ABC-2 type transport system permease protein